MHVNIDSRKIALQKTALRKIATEKIASRKTGPSLQKISTEVKCTPISLPRKTNTYKGVTALRKDSNDPVKECGRNQAE